jgi:small conductance mechanosensitive channel
MRITITYADDIEKAKAVLLEAAAATAGVLRQPEPLFMVLSFGKDGVDLLFGVWIATEDWVEANNAMFMAVHKRFDAAGIDFAYPTMTIHSGKA